MICITDFLAHIRLTMKLQEQMLKNICETWQLTITEGKVISFLYNNRLFFFILPYPIQIYPCTVSIHFRLVLCLYSGQIKHFTPYTVNTA